LTENLSVHVKRPSKSAVLHRSRKGGAMIAALGCFVWGMISVVFSPCHLASIPLIVAYVGGQERAVNPKQAGIYSAAFTFGLFITIALIGIICALLGRMLGDVGNYWQILVGLVLVWVALGMFGVEKCSMSALLYWVWPTACFPVHVHSGL